MVTLRNPMFHPPQLTPSVAPPGAGPLPSSPQNTIRLRSSTGQVMDTPAAIIQNENGMFTIRNPALHQAYTNSGLVGGPPVRPNGSGLGSMYQTDEEPVPAAPVTIPIDVAASQAWKIPVAPENGGQSTGKKAAIGSEMKQARQEAAWGTSRGGFHGQNEQQTRSYSPFDSQLNLGSSYAGLNGHNPVSAAAPPPPPGYLAKSGFSAFVASGASGDHGCSGGDPNHQCEDPHPSTLVNDQKYFRESPLMNMMGQAPYSDFIQHLQPGQRLNSEVR